MTSARLDKWLWFARFAKTRSLAAKLCTRGSVTVGSVPVAKAAHPVYVGDALTVRQGRLLRRVTVLALGERRGPPAEARLLYAEAEMPLALRDVERRAWTPLIEEEDEQSNASAPLGEGRTRL
jgi:ribosome-associated heat shock protein Hsp15